MFPKQTKTVQYINRTIGVSDDQAEGRCEGRALVRSKSDILKEGPEQRDGSTAHRTEASAPCTRRPPVWSWGSLLGLSFPNTK